MIAMTALGDRRRFHRGDRGKDGRQNRRFADINDDRLRAREQAAERRNLGFLRASEPVRCRFKRESTALLTEKARSKTTISLRDPVATRRLR